MAEFEIKGWCPSALRPMVSGDGLVVRISPRLARLTAVQARGIAEAAATHGNGLIDLTARGNIQLRGVRDGTYQELLAGLVALDLIDPTETPDSRRTLMVSPFWQTEDGTESLVAELERSLAQAPALPDKFGFAVDVGPRPVLSLTAADIRLERNAAGALILRPDGSIKGQAVTATTAAPAALDLARWFVATGGVRQGRGRMVAHIARGATLPEGFTSQPADPDKTPKIGPHPLGFLVGFEFGQIRAETLAALATQPLRITPWRMVLLEGAVEAPDIPGMITDPADPRLRVTACTGAPGCPQGLQPTRPLARSLAAEVPEGQHLHVSGCAKGCAHPGPADVTLTATPAGFNLICNGRASDAPEQAYDPSGSIFKVLT